MFILGRDGGGTGEGQPPGIRAVIEDLLSRPSDRRPEPECGAHGGDLS